MDKKIVFNKDEFEFNFGIFLNNKDYMDYSSLYILVNDSIKEYGLDSNYIELVEPLLTCAKKADLLQINTYINGINEYSMGEVLAMFVYDAYNDEMKDCEFSKRVCAYIKKEYPECYEEFEKNVLKRQRLD